MPSNAYRDRAFLPAEVRRILRRAAEFDDLAQAPSAAGRGHTLEEIERIAGDAGISETALRRAIAGEEAPGRTRRRTFSLAPAPASLSVARTSRGLIHTARHEELARAIRSAVGMIGDARSTGSALRWSSSTMGGRNVQALVEPVGGGRVSVRVDEDLRSLRGTIFSGTFAGGLLLFLPIIAFFAHAGVPYILFGWLISAYLAGWILYGRRVAAREAQLEAVAAEILAVVGARAQVAAEDGALAPARIASYEDSEPEEAVEEADGPPPARRQR
jgi:hypothetical protein